MLKNIIKIAIIQILTYVLSIIFYISFSPSPIYPNYSLRSAIFHNGILISVMYVLCGMLLIDQKSKLNNFFSVFRGYILLSILTLIIPKDLSFLMIFYIYLIVTFPKRSLIGLNPSLSTNLNQVSCDVGIPKSSFIIRYSSPPA
ncbi:hypothetical protein A0J52_16310 [Clostridium sporogenes]|uniref:hypothetical protein n=1 Tax=Clostridium sporogenes TaxID=1509 RepID=UPI00077FF081|nr:hypothetical protein [Clostridium sporogenes]KYN75939.1 hypothetical protein A0J52_16310 [Clostridium sporogenes]NFM16009.1 hypothetical protein [Clostridium sporogenes]